MDSRAFRLFYIGQLSLKAAFRLGAMSGDWDRTRSFFALFDWPGRL